MYSLICSHGFGVRADSRGMFPEIAAAIPSCKTIMFDYNTVLPNGDTIVPSLAAQAELLQQQIDSAEAPVVLLCHSQGCLIAGLVDLANVSKVILLAPPVSMSMRGAIERLQKRTGSAMEANGDFRLARSDGTLTFLSSEYLDSIDAVVPMSLYQNIANTTSTTIVRATEDEIIGLTNVTDISNSTHIDISAHHNFTGEARLQLITSLQQIISS